MGTGGYKGGYQGGYQGGYKGGYKGGYTGGYKGGYKGGYGGFNLADLGGLIWDRISVSSPANALDTEVRHAFQLHARPFNHLGMCNRLLRL